MWRTYWFFAAYLRRKRSSCSWPEEKGEQSSVSRSALMETVFGDRFALHQLPKLLRRLRPGTQSVENAPYGVLRDHESRRDDELDRQFPERLKMVLEGLLDDESFLEPSRADQLLELVLDGAGNEGGNLGFFFHLYIPQQYSTKV